VYKADLFNENLAVVGFDALLRANDHAPHNLHGFKELMDALAEINRRPLPAHS
jgi:2-keto-3-deoxy-L-rhamnonate aldolase RhmA